MSARFSRNGYSHPLGKMQPPLGQLRLPESADEKLRKLAAANRKGPIEFARDLLTTFLVGRDEIQHSQMMYLDALDSLLPKSTKQDSR